MITATLDYLQQSGTSKKFQIRDWSNYSREALQNKLSQVDLSSLELLTVESLNSELNQILGTILDELCPTITIKTKGSESLISPKVARLARKKKKILQKKKIDRI